MNKLFTRSILAVDDEPEHTRLLAALLHQFAVEAAHTAKAALRMAKIRPFHLYILDYRLPDTDGAELCRRIRGFDPHTPIVVLSGDMVAKQALLAGANIFIQKGGDPLQLSSCVTSLIARQAVRNETARDAEARAIAEAVKAQAARATTEASRLHAQMREAARHVAQTRKALEAIRQLRTVAFQTYAQSGGARAGFIEDWPRTCPDSAHDSATG